MEKLERTVLQYMKDQQLIQAGDRLLIACSGGVDSIALLHFFDKMKGYLDIHIAAVHVDHMLRGEQSAGDKYFVEQFCQQRGIEYYSRAIDIPSILKHEGGNSQAICRRERYRYFEEVVQNHPFTKIATAHHADDQLESILMALTKANMTNSLKGILAKRPFLQIQLIRPFLVITKCEIREYLQQQQESFREDPSNAKTDYTRNRFRHCVVPLLKEENPRVATHAVHLSEQLQQDDAFIMALASEKFEKMFQKSEEGRLYVKIEAFQNEPLALQRRLILILLNYIYGDSNTFQSYALNISILKLFESQQGSAIIQLPEGFIARRQYDEVIFEKQLVKDVAKAKQITPNAWCEWHHMRIYIGEIARGIPSYSEHAQCYYFQSTDMAWPLMIRARQEGDRMAQVGMQHHKKVSRIFIDEKIPSVKRDYWPLLVNAQNEILAVLGIRVNHMIAKTIRPYDDYILIIEEEC